MIITSGFLVLQYIYYDITNILDLAYALVAYFD